MQWWGYSNEHGWVVLDRSIPSNRPGIDDDLLFLRCRDSTIFFTTRGAWNAPMYVFAPNYIRGLSPLDADVATRELEALQCRWPELQAEIQGQYREAAERAVAASLEAERAQQRAALERKRQYAIVNHQRFLESRGIPYQGISEASQRKDHRITHCYSCHHPLDNAIDAECVVCRWIICTCGACGCGYVP